MSIIAYPLEATEYTAGDAQSYLSTRTSGVYSDEITFTPEGMSVTVSPFLAWFNYAKFKGCSVAVTEPETLTFSPAHAVLGRIDRVVLRLDLSINKAYMTIIEGEPSSTPTPPEISKTKAVNDISPFYVTVKAGATEITDADITSTILDESVCGIMRDGVTGIPTSQLQAQAEALIIRLHEVINDVEADTACMLRDLYDPEDKAKPVAFKDETPAYNESIDDCNAAINTGWYVCGLGCKNTPDEEVFRYASLDVVRRSTAIYQTITYEHISARRYATSSDGGATWSWKKWEWINPPLDSDYFLYSVEYRTTERYNGKPVYIMKFDGGELLADNEISYNVGKNLNIVSIDGKATKGNYTIPINIFNQLNSLYYDKSTGQLTFDTKSGASKWSVEIVVKYTK